MDYTARKELTAEVVWELRAACRKEIPQAEGKARAGQRHPGGKGTERASVGEQSEGVGRSVGPDHPRPGGHDRALQCSQEPGVGELKQIGTMIWVRIWEARSGCRMDGSMVNEEAGKLEALAAGNPGVRWQELRLGSCQLRVHHQGGWAPWPEQQ